MGKRQQRFTGTSVTSKELLSKVVNLVKKDGTVFHVKIIEINSEFILGEDQRKKKIKFALNDIYEIVIDLVAAY